MADAVPIPEPKGYPLIGNLAEFSDGGPLKTLKRLADTYGPIYRIHIGSQPRVVVSTVELVSEVFNEKRFRKSVKGSLKNVRDGVHDGLFTAFDDEPNWSKAHRVLTPAFGPLSIRTMFDEMYDISSQMIMKFARHGPNDPINSSDDFTRLALDTIALCAMGYRFNSYYHEELHPFVQAMGDFLTESGVRNRRPAFAPAFLYRSADAKYQADIDLLRGVAGEVVQARKEDPDNGRKDLLTAMLEGVDPTTGEKLSDENIIDQLITFLIAGHETTSGMLSFAFYQLLKHPSAYEKVQEEVDRVVGHGPVRVEHLSKLPYIAGVLRETLRVTSSIAAISVEPYEDTLIGGKYLIHKEEPIIVLLAKSQTDPAVWGDDALEFKPERLVDEEFNRISKEHPHAWKPFGNGKRSCIGRPFAWQEAILAMAMLFQNFNFSMSDPNYQLQIKETLTVKPNNFFMKATLRHGMTPTELERRLAGEAASTHPQHQSGQPSPPKTKASGKGKPLAVYYGSQSGTCEALAQRIAADASQHGFHAAAIGPLDSASQKLPKDMPVVIITASYEGEPPSNAAHFVNWLEGLSGPTDLEGVSYAVFGCGHQDWAQTFQRIPKLVDSTLADRGADRLVDMSYADASTGDMFTDFEAWEDQTLWPALQSKYGTQAEEGTNGATSSLTVQVTSPRKATLRQDVEEAEVISARTLSRGGDESKRHLEVRLPTDMSYSTGDYLAVLPLNPRDSIARVFRRFGISWDAALRIESEGPTTLPTGSETPAADVLGAYVELNQPATKRNILILAETTDVEDDSDKLKNLASDAYQDDILAKKVSVLDLLERYPSVALPFGTYLAMLPPMRVRQYSISSSPLADPSKATITFSLLDQPSLSGHGRHLGVATNFLSTLSAGDRLHVAVRHSAAAFSLPRDAESVPIICVAAGAGLAPFRGFVQERASMLAAGRTLAPALLFYGCRSPDKDDLYQEEFKRWQDMGAVDVRRAFSRDQERSQGCRYVQDRMWHDRAELGELWNKGARVYVCGSRQVGKAVDEVCDRMAKQWADEHMPAEEREVARAKFMEKKNERFATDVFD